MSEYEEYSLNLSRPQVAKLAKGKKIRLSHQQLTTPGDVKIFLTPQQARRVQTRVSKGLGVDIGGFDVSQIEHNVKFGMGFWSSMSRFLKGAATALNQKVIQPVYQGLRPALENARDRVVQRGVNLGQDLLDKGLRRIGAGSKPKKGVMPPALARYWAARRAAKAGSAKAGKGVSDMFGFGVEPMVVPKRRGKGFFSGLAKIVRPVAGQLASDAIKTYVAPAVGNAISGNQEGQGLTGNFGLFGNGMKRRGGKKVCGSFRLNSGR